VVYPHEDNSDAIRDQCDRELSQYRDYNRLTLRFGEMQNRSGKALQ
jgi:hypothetical protein